jgi:predicted  nucleic acid-binding Zn-ribbon protein
MEWVIALLAVGCVFFGVQVIVDYVKYKRVIEPRIDRIEKTKADLRSRIEEAEAELGHARGEIGPAKDELQRLQREYQDIHEAVQDETARHRNDPNSPGLSS